MTVLWITNILKTICMNKVFYFVNVVFLVSGENLSRKDKGQASLSPRNWKRGVFHLIIISNNNLDKYISYLAKKVLLSFNYLFRHFTVFYEKTCSEKFCNNHKKITSLGVFLNKLFWPAILSKRLFNAGVFLGILRYF